jgi:pimeloyl-ACP methyl ester carboxylesterase
VALCEATVGRKIHGDRSRPAGPRRFLPAVGHLNKKTLGADIAGLVVDHLGFKKFHLVGHDWGGPVAFSVAAHHPDAVRTLTILDVVIPGDGGDFSQGGRRWHHAFFRTLDLPEQLCFGREEMVVNWFFENYGHRSNCIAEEDKAEFLRTYKKPGAFRALLEIYRTLPRDAEDNRDNDQHPDIELRFAGHMAGHGKLGAAAGCVVGHHEANKPNPNNSNAQAPSDRSSRSDDALSPPDAE